MLTDTFCSNIDTISEKCGSSARLRQVDRLADCYWTLVTIWWLCIVKYRQRRLCGATLLLFSTENFLNFLTVYSVHFLMCDRCVETKATAFA